MGRQDVEHHANAFGARIMHVGELAHAGGEVFCGPPLGDLHLPPRTVHIQDHEQVRGAVAPVLAVSPPAEETGDLDPVLRRRAMSTAALSSGCPSLFLELHSHRAHWIQSPRKKFRKFGEPFRPRLHPM
jgi:hypothetical protein